MVDRPRDRDEPGRYPIEEPMPNQSVVLPILALALIMPGALTKAHELPRFGVLPELDGDWKLHESNTKPLESETNPFRWIVFKNGTNGDLLSWATFPLKANSDRPLVLFSDTALEIFPDGLAVWDHNDTRMVIDAITISPKERRLSSRSRTPVLEYAFISESMARPNLMAQGRAWFEPGYIIYIQH